MENSQTLWNSSDGMTTSKLKHVQKQPIFVHYAEVQEVETAKSFDELMTSRSIVGRIDFPDYDSSDAMIVSSLKKLFEKHVHFRRRVSVEERRAQKYNRFLRGRQIAHVIYEHFRASGAYDAVQGLSDLCNIRLQNDDVQDFDVRCDQALLSASETYRNDSGRLYKSKLQDSVQLQIVLALYDQRTVRNHEQPSYSRLKTAVRLPLDQAIRARNFRVWNEVV